MVVGALVLLAILFVACTHILRQGAAVIISRLGRPVTVVSQPGLHWKLPWPIDVAAELDLRRRSFETRHTEMLTRDKKNIILLSYAVWQVDDPLLFYQSIGETRRADEKLDGLITNAKIGVLGKYPLSALASVNSQDLKITEIEQELLRLTRPIASQKYGIYIASIGFRRLSLPKSNVTAVFKQMRAERKQFSAEFQAQGEQEAAKIRSETDLEVAKIEAQSAEQVARIGGEAEVTAAQIYSEAHRKDPNLYRFVRSLDTLETVIGSQSTVILRTDSAPFRLLSVDK